MNDFDISVVIPVFNEEDSMSILCELIDENLKGKQYEILIIDDGSTDNTPKILEKLAAESDNISVITLRRNIGKAVALDIAFRKVNSDIIVTIDGDLQDDPAEIPKFIDKIENGYDLVVGWKYNRKDPINKTLPSKFFNFLTRRMTGVNLHDFNCGFKAYRKDVLNNLSLYGEMHRYIPVLANQYGFKIAEIKVKHHSRKYGKSKYSTYRIIEGFLDLITVTFLSFFATKPLHIFGIFGLLSILFGFVIDLYLLFLKYIKNYSIGDRPLLLLSVLLILVGFQFISMGLLSEMIVFQNAKKQDVDSLIKNELNKRNT